MARYTRKQGDHKSTSGLSKTPSPEELMYRDYVRQKLIAGLADIKAGRVHPHESIRNEFIAGVRKGLDQLDRGEGIAIEQAEKLIASWTSDKGSPRLS